MSTLIIRKVLKDIAAALTKLLNECLDASFPQTFLKIVRAVTIFNKGDPNNRESKRSIVMCRLLLVLSKICLEVIMKRKFKPYFVGRP